ncbi:hypothetical protein NQ315_004616 [Exocentrus adspersus]|uniref:Uncharacterized protein n=1 Tax=Exocentrus adspersus TaxID=1586481 RepID=A0AAV8VNT1_9CUCU|nr:hypothetical protein NQ315_004616 [Exocentrus adspersus]
MFVIIYNIYCYVSGCFS